MALVLPSALVVLTFSLFFLGALGSVLVYSGRGTSSDLIDHLVASLKEAGLQPTKALASHFDKAPWERDCELLIIPGGRDLEYVAELSSEALDRIRKWVGNGGSLLGLCAGSYFSASRIAFEVGGQFEVKGKRELALYPGTAYGSAIRPFSYTWNEHARAANVRMNAWKSKSVVSLYFMGGCYFDVAEVKKHGWRVMGTYAHSGKPAIISGKFGKGNIILACPHIEVSHNRMKGIEESWMYLEMGRTPKRRNKLFSYVINKLRSSKTKTRETKV